VDIAEWLDPTALSSPACTLPALLPAVTRRGAEMRCPAGLTYRDMYLGRADLGDRWRMPIEWQTDTAELPLQCLNGVRLVLSHRGFNLLANQSEPHFLCLQVRARDTATGPARHVLAPALHLRLHRTFIHTAHALHLHLHRTFIHTRPRCIRTHTYRMAAPSARTCS
jgi:hypothetical protein